MKKIFTLLLIFFSLLTLSSCFNRKETIAFLDVAFKTVNGEVIEGEYFDYYHRIPEEFFKRKGIKKYNSPAPRTHYYCAEIEKNSSVIVDLQFEDNSRLYDLTKVIFQIDNNHLRELEVVDFEKKKDIYYASVLIKNITTDNDFYHLYQWYDEDGEPHFFKEHYGIFCIRGFAFTFKK